MVSLGAVLEQFPDDVIVYVTDPRTGIQRRSEWPPSIAKVIEACEEHQEYLRKLRSQRQSSAASRPYEKPVSIGAIKVFVAQDHPGYSKVHEWSKTADAEAWVPYTAPDGRKGMRVEPQALIDLGLMRRGL